jgi:hypothetical protein
VSVLCLGARADRVTIVAITGRMWQAAMAAKPKP